MTLRYAARGKDQGAPAEAGRSDTIDGGEPTTAGAEAGSATGGSVSNSVSGTGSESVDDATLSFLAGGRSASRRVTS